MFKREIVFVVGAGASAEMGVPVGSELRDKVSELVNVRFNNSGRASGDVELFEQLAAASPQNRKLIQEVGWQISDGIYGKNSIDEYLDWQNGNSIIVNYGKAALFKSILREESAVLGSRFGSGWRLADLSSTWYGRLLELLLRNHRREDAGGIFNNVSFIIFNYDRCVEYFFYMALQKMGVSEVDARSVCSGGGTFFHAYGSLGALFGDNALAFGSRATLDYPKLSARIRTFTEQQEKGAAEEIKHRISSARTIVFLGLSYGEPNLQLLRPESSAATERIYGTGYKLSNSFREHLANTLLLFFNPDSINWNNQGRVFVTPNQCGELIGEYGELLHRRHMK